MNRKLFLLIILLLMCAHIAFPQTVTNPGGSTVSPEIKKEAVAFLRETSADVNGLRTLENRVSFSAELAGLMWFEDEKEARTMFQVTINDFRQLFAQYDMQLNALETSSSEEQVYSPVDNAAGQLRRKFMKAIAVRQQIATAIAEHDPQLALNFYSDTALVITNPTYKKQIEGQDSYFETRLLMQIAEKDVDTALKYARKSLEKGFNYETLSLLKKIYDKEPDKGISFGEDILSKLKSDKSDPENFYIYNSLLDLGAESFETAKGQPGKKPIFSEQSVREIADLFAQQILARDEDEGAGFSSFLPKIEKYAPSRAAQIRQKFSIRKPSSTSNSMGGGESPPPAVPVSNTEVDSSANLTDKVASLDAPQISKEEREKTIASARKIIADIKDPNQKIVALTALALKVSRTGDKELAVEIMNEGRNLVNLQPKNYLDFMKIWMLAGGYAPIDAEKSFTILEDAVFRLNETISAFVKVGEFMDVNGDIIDNGEIQVGSFGGEISRELLRNLGATDTTIRSLAVADFTRTRALANKFDRPEARILAKMLILRGILGGGKENTPASNEYK